MAIEPLLWFCLDHKTSISDDGIELSIARKSGETILLFRTDSEDFRKCFYDVGASQTACDGLFFYKYGDNPPILVFVELKGANLAHALKQLKTTILPVKERVEGVIRDGTKYLALVVSDGAGPTTRKNKQREFEDETRVHLLVKTTARRKKAVDLRAVLRQVEWLAPIVAA
jgi:hypothetical protein